MPDFLKHYLKHCGRTLILILMFQCAAAYQVLSAPCTTTRYAKGFRVECDGNIARLFIFPMWKEKASPREYILVPKGEKLPSVHAGATIIQVPVTRIACLSTTHLAYLDAANMTDRIVAVSSFKTVNTPGVVSRIAQGKIKETGFAPNVNMEIVMDLHPDLTLVSANGDAYDVHPKLREAGLSTLPISDHLETHPLGRCEWLKVLALLLQTTAHGENLFNRIESRYLALQSMTEQVNIRPRIIMGLPFQGQWWVPRGDSYLSTFITHAGGRYLFNTLPGTGSLAMDVEAVYEKALDADIWLHPGIMTSVAQIRASDPRFASIGAIAQGHVYNNDKRTNETGGNDFWESGCLYPDKVLEDLIYMFHPELLPGHKLMYHRKLK